MRTRQRYQQPHIRADASASRLCESGTWLMSNHEATVFIVLVFGIVVLAMWTA
jgi:hypothetical protein